MNWVWDRTNRQLVRSQYSLQTVSRLDLIVRDTYVVNVSVCTPQSGNALQSYLAGELAAGESLLFGAKTLAGIAGNYLISCASWVKVGAGAAAYYTGQITLDTVDLIAALGTSAYIDIIGELVVVGPDNSHRDSTQWPIRISPDVNRGGEGIPVPSYSVLQQFTDIDGIAKVRIVNALGETCGVFAPL